jgi:2-dehydropantoate 2-reductase
VAECRAVAEASGCDVGETVEERMMHIDTLADVKTSMLQDLEAKRPLELEPIAGAVVELAAQLNVPVPRVETVYSLARLLARAEGVI